MAEYIDISRRANPGVYIEERDFSIFNITSNYNRIFFVAGCSDKGPFNVPIVVISPENFEDIFGKQDLNLERKGSYFHRTVKNLLKAGPVICLNLRLTDEELDKYNWQSLSVSADYKNAQRRSNPLRDFYDRSSGFWKRNKDNLLDISLENLPDAESKPLSFVNTSDKPISILAYKSDIRGFDITVEDWYDGQYPQFLHPKDRISDYMVQVALVEGRWNNYEELSIDPEWSRYFSKTGIKTDQVNAFYNHPTVNLIKKWETSLIPYFQDKSGNDLYIESVINSDVNETGVYVSYNSDSVEKDFRTGNIDLLGDSLTCTGKRHFDFLSYNRFLTDFFVIEERFIDSPGNVFGNHLVDKGAGRTMLFSEGYAHNVKLKPIIISTTTSLSVKPIDAGDDSYIVFNGKRFDLTSDIEDVIALHEVVKPGYRTAYLVLITDNGIEFRMGDTRPQTESIYLPSIDNNKEMVLGYYTLAEDLLGNYTSTLTGILLDDIGFVNPFRIGTEMDSKIRFLDTDYDWILNVYFEDIFKPASNNYQQQRLYHLWSWLSENLIEGDSMTLDINGNKQLIEWIEPGNDGNGRYLKVGVKDRSSDVFNTASTSGKNGFYSKDIEFIPQDEIEWEEKIEPFTFGDGGIIGDDSLLKESYKKGDINSGDPFFWSFSEETNVSFVKDVQNMIVIPDGPLVSDYANRTVIVNGSVLNDGIFTILSLGFYNDDPVLIVQEEVKYEANIDLITFFDGEDPKIVNLYEIQGKLKATVEEYDGILKTIYERLDEDKDQDGQWAKTLEIEEIINESTILVDHNRYATQLEKGYFLLGKEIKITNIDEELPRSWTRIIDLVLYDNDPTKLMVITDAPIEFRDFEGDFQTDIFIPIYQWVDSLDFKVLEPFIVRKEVLPDGSEEKQNRILDLLAPNTKMSQALLSDNIEWRYLVDSFGLGMTTRSKYQLASLVEAKHLAFGFLNMPSIKEFRKLGDTYATGGRFDTKKILEGGNRKNSGSKRFSVTDKGQSHVTYLTPYVAKKEDSRFRLVPPACYVAEMYMKKFNDNRLKAWDIVAGIRDGKVTTIEGLETMFSEEQLRDLNQYNVTPLTAFNNITYYLYNEATPVNRASALRFIHIREGLIELESELKEELRFFQWKFFGDQLNVDITKKANDICEQYKRDDAIADYQNVFVATPELIDSQIGVLYTYVEPIFGMGSITLTVNILGTSQVQSTFGG